MAARKKDDRWYDTPQAARKAKKFATTLAPEAFGLLERLSAAFPEASRGELILMGLRLLWGQRATEDSGVRPSRKDKRSR